MPLDSRSSLSAVWRWYANLENGTAAALLLPAMLLRALATVGLLAAL
jgi:hypothetical protein